MLTVSYEQVRGKRLLYQRPDGYQISKSKLITASIDAAFKAWRVKSIRNKWLTDPDITIRKATHNHTLRITWVGGVTALDVSFYSKGDKVQVNVNHSKMPIHKKRR